MVSCSRFVDSSSVVPYTRLADSLTTTVFSVRIHVDELVVHADCAELIGIARRKPPLVSVAQIQWMTSHDGSTRLQVGCVGGQ